MYVHASLVSALAHFSSVFLRCHVALLSRIRARARRNLFAGFLIGRAQMVPWWSWYYYINPVAWSLCAHSFPAPSLCQSQVWRSCHLRCCLWHVRLCGNRVDLCPGPFAPGAYDMQHAQRD